MIPEKTYLSTGDFIDLYYKVKLKGYHALLSKLHLTNLARTVSKWNHISPDSDFWIIPAVRNRWNEKCTGDPNMEYEDYVVSKYFGNAHDLRILSVGCGTGSRERKFAKYEIFSSIEGIDLAASQVEEARETAASQNLDNIHYFTGDFSSYPFESEAYDLILFNSSLHHFDRINEFLKLKVMPLLKKEGYLIIYEYVGPKRLQWIRPQLNRVNQLLNKIPAKYRTRFNSQAIKHRIYRPGLLRMLMVDPSEAIDSESILPSIHKHFRVIEEKKVGWDILHPLLKDISHNFLGTDKETQTILAELFEQEDNYMAESGRSDAVFGIYQKR
ncbi:MAG: class I SAM-dependent methyltransferase [Bacteroidales bacterium]